MWESIYREGNNWMQEKVMSNNKFRGSRLERLLNGTQQAFNQFVNQVQQQPTAQPLPQTFQQVHKQEAFPPVQVKGNINTVLGQFAPTDNFNDDNPF